MERLDGIHTVDEVYDLYLRPEHLGAGGIKAKITDAYAASMQPRPGPRKAIVLVFENMARYLILSRTQADSMVDITDTTEFSRWIGATVNLVPAVDEHDDEGRPLIEIWS